METVWAFFIRAKHWQIFLLIIGPLLFGPFVAYARMNASSELGLVLASLAGSIIGATSMVSLIGWYGSLGIVLNSLGRPKLTLNTGFFRFALVYHVLYDLVFVTLVSSSGSTKMPSILLPFTVFAPICLLYILYFGSRSLVMAESGKPVALFDYLGSMFLLWLFPIGIWIVQPRANRLGSQRNFGEVPTAPISLH